MTRLPPFARPPSLAFELFVLLRAFHEGFYQVFNLDAPPTAQGINLGGLGGISFLIRC